MRFMYPIYSLRISLRWLSLFHNVNEYNRVGNGGPFFNFDIIDHFDAFCWLSIMGME